MDETTRVLLELLKQAAAAHGLHEEQELGGVYDEQWPEWYAAHMASSLATMGYAVVPSATGPEAHGAMA